MRQSELQNRLVKRRLIALAILAPLAAILFLYPHISSTTIVAAQRKRPQQTPRRPTRPTTSTSTPARRSSRFKHEDHRPPRAKLDCSSCHKIPSAAPLADADPLEHTRDVAAATKPSVKGYPYHDSCVRCHRDDFFKGASPAICTVCHTSSSPRLTARNMLTFPKQGKQAVAREFPGYFPHSLHQGVIARNRKPDGLNEALFFVRASFTAPADTPQAVDNCAVCHVTDRRKPEAIAVGGAEKSFTPPEGTFKTSPLGHASCFNCHWESQKPTKDDCAGCHLTPADVAKKKRGTSAKALEWKDWPSDWPKRFSLKFSHESKNHQFGCTTCHINITQMETLNIQKADVPITTCTQCHLQDTSTTSLKKEMFAREKDAKFVCASCHTSVIGSQPPKCSHYQVLGQQCKP